MTQKSLYSNKKERKRRKMEMIELGWHVIAELNGVDPRILDDEKYLVETLKNAAEIAGLTILSVKTHKFNPQGVSVVVVVAESHIFIHTWPEHRYAALDIFTCKSEESTWKAYKEILKKLKPGNTQVIMLKRGIVTHSNAMNLTVNAEGTTAAKGEVIVE